jgi:hypothetical protein
MQLISSNFPDVLVQWEFTWVQWEFTWCKGNSLGALSKENSFGGAKKTHLVHIAATHAPV